MKNQLLKVKESSDPDINEAMRESLNQVYNILDKTKEKQIDTETLEVVLNAQQLLEDLEKK